MPEFSRETQRENRFDASFLATELSKLSASNFARQPLRSKVFGFIEFEGDESSEAESVENLNEPESDPEPVFTSSGEKLAHTLNSIHDPSEIEEFEQIIADMGEAATSEREKEDIRHYGEFYTWAMKGYDAEPPESVIAVRREDYSQLTIECNPQLLTKADEDRILSKFVDKEPLVRELRWRRLEAITANKEKIHKCLEEIITDSPAYNLLKSLSTENPYDPEERPLNALERTAREAQSEQEVKRRFGMDSNESITSGTNAARLLQRKNYGIDDERIREKTINTANVSIDPLRHYFAEVIRDQLPDGEWRQQIAGEPVELVSPSPFTCTIRPVNPALHDVEVPLMSKYDIAASVVEPFGLNGLDDHVAKLTINCAISNMHRDQYETVDEVLDDIRRSVSGNIFFNRISIEPFAPSVAKSLTGIEVYDQERYKREVKAHDSSRKALDCAEESYDKALEPPAETGDWSFNLRDMEEASSGAGDNSLDFKADTGFGFSTQEAIEAGEAETVGVVMGFNADGVMRLIQSADKNINLPPASGDADFVFVTDTSNGFAAHDPKVGGYELVGRSNNVYEFVKQESGDPYVDCQVEIPFEARQVLAQEYDALGLTNLSGEVLRGGHFTASDLVNAIKDNSNYYKPPERIDVSESPEFNDFQDFVIDNKLQVQCSGAGHFLKLSLNKVFGKDSAEIIGGLSFDGDGQVTHGSSHGQTQFEHNGETYIFDATPGGISELAEQLEQIRAPEIIVEQTPEEKLNLQFEQLERNLSAVFKTADTRELHAKLSALPDHDPSRRALEILSGLNSNQETSEYLEYVDSIKQALTTKDRRLEQLGIGKYSVELLDLLQSQVKKAQGLLVQMGK